MEKEIADLMEKLNCTEEQARDVADYDKKVDKAKASDRLEYDLSIEQEKVAKKYANVTEHKKPTAYKWTTRQRKENTNKKGVIADLFEFLQESGYEETEIVNAEKVITFKIGDKRYELNLIEKRKPKT